MPFGEMPSQNSAEMNPAEAAMKKFGVDLNDDKAVLQKMNALQGKMPDVADLSNLWKAYQKSEQAN